MLQGRGAYACATPHCGRTYYHLIITGKSRTLLPLPPPPASTHIPHEFFMGRANTLAPPPTRGRPYSHWSISGGYANSCASSPSGAHNLTSTFHGRNKYSCAPSTCRSIGSHLSIPVQVVEMFQRLTPSP